MKYFALLGPITVLFSLNNLIISSCQSHDKSESGFTNRISFPYDINSEQDSSIKEYLAHLDSFLQRLFLDTAPQKDTTINRRHVNINCSSQLLDTKYSPGIKKGAVKVTNLVLACQTDSLEDAKELENLIMRLDYENNLLIYDNYNCTAIEDSNSRKSVDCIFNFSQRSSLSPKYRFRTLSKDTQSGSGNGTTEPHKATITEYISNGLGISESTTLILLALLVFVILLAITICIWMRKKKKKLARNNQGDRQKLVIKTSQSPAVSVPELTSPTAKLNQRNAHQIFSTDPNTGMSPVHSLKSVPNLKLEEDNRSSNLPDEVMFTNIDDSPESVSEGSSRMSVKNPPRGLDFNIEFSMAEHGSILKIQDNLANKTYDE